MATILVCLALLFSVGADRSIEEGAARVLSSTKTWVKTSNPGQADRPLETGVLLHPGTIIRGGPDSSVTLLLSHGDLGRLQGEFL